jgi:two-component system KDP operon response regulator KdpE
MQDQNSFIDVNNENGIGADLDEVYASNRKRVLVIEDEPETGFLLKHILRSAGYNVLGAYSGKEALKKFSEVKPNLVLLDLMMSGMDGWETYQYLRQMSDVPVMIISAVTNKDEVVKALRSGVDDYLTKPFVNAEVVARVEAILRRSQTSPADIDRLLFPDVDLIVDFRTQEIIHCNQHIQLTGREFAILAMLARSAPAIVAYHDIAMEIWEEDTAEARNRIKYLVHLLRRKFQRLPGQPDFIENVDRLGYKLRTTHNS